MAPKKYTMWLLLYGTFFTIGAGLSYVAWQYYQKTQKLLSDGVRTTAVVTQLIVNSDSEGDTYTPIFEFKDRTNTIRTFKSPISSSPPTHQVNDKVKIVYDKNDFSNAKTIGFWGLYRVSVILMMVASPFLVIGGSYLLYALY